MDRLPTAIVDAHHHLWELDKGSYPWLQECYNPSEFILGHYQPLRENFGVAELRERFGDAPVIASVHIEAERNRDEALAETRWLHEQSAIHRLPNAIVAWCDLLAPDADERLAEQAAFPLVRAIRFKPVTGSRVGEHPMRAGSLRDPDWPAALEQLAKHGLRWDLRIPYWHLQEAAQMLWHAPRIPVVLEHTGLPWDRSVEGLAIWRAGMKALAALPNVHLKLSELGLKDREWNRRENVQILVEALQIFGWQRCLFGSNFPVASLRANYSELIHMTQQALETAQLNAAQQQAVWCRNALTFYAIEGVDA